LAKDMSLYDIYTQAVQSIFGRPSGVRWEGPCGLYVPASDHHADTRFKNVSDPAVRSILNADTAPSSISLIANSQRPRESLATSEGLGSPAVVTLAGLSVPSSGPKRKVWMPST
jgi:hypothetical protein